jgi:hypothetical protein
MLAVGELRAARLKDDARAVYRIARRHVDAVKVLAIPVLLRARHMEAPEGAVVIEFRLSQFADVERPRTILAVRLYKARSAVPDSVGVVSFEASAPSRNWSARLAKASSSV